MPVFLLIDFIMLDWCGPSMAIQEVQTRSKELNLQDPEICCILQQSTPAFFEIEKLKSMVSL